MRCCWFGFVGLVNAVAVVVDLVIAVVVVVLGHYCWINWLLSLIRSLGDGGGIVDVVGVQRMVSIELVGWYVLLSMLLIRIFIIPVDIVIGDSTHLFLLGNGVPFRYRSVGCCCIFFRHSRGFRYLCIDVWLFGRLMTSVDGGCVSGSVS